jgi:tetratricopeptide (TPR) repeat protein
MDFLMDKKQRLIVLILGILAFGALLAAYSNHWHNSFHFDDSHTIQTNAYIRDIRNIPLFFKSSETFSSLPQNQAYRPLVSTTLAIDYWLTARNTPNFNPLILDTFYFHLSTFIWYAIQCVLLFFIFLKIFNTAKPHRWNPFLALFGAAYYAVHAANAETVNYIISRTDILSTVGVVVSFFLYLYSPFCKKTYLYIIPAAIGIFAKETASMFPFLLIVYIYLFESDKKNHLVNTIKKTIPAFIVCGVLIVFAVNNIPKTWQPGNLSRFSYLITQPFVMIHYFNAFFLPFNLSADTDWKAINNIFDDRFLAGIVFILLMIYIAYKCSKGKETKPITFGIAWFFLSLGPTSSLIPFSEVMNDHRIFFPFIGLMVSAVWSIGLIIINKENQISNRPILKTIIISAAFIIIAAHSYGTYQRNIVWETDESLWLDVTKKSPENGRGLMNYGLSQMAKAKYDVALDYFTRALVYNPYYAYLHTNLGVVKGVLGQDVEAEMYFKNGILYGSQYPDCYYYYAVWLNGKGRRSEAIDNLNKALSLSPGHNDAKNYLNMILSSNDVKNIKSPLEQSEEFVKAKPTAENYLNLSLQYYNLKRYDDCIAACNEAIKLKPDFPEAYNNICSAYNSLGKYDLAIDACNMALKFSPGFELAKNNLKVAKEKSGK